MNNTNKAFSLIELIVVITILAILSTISFISYTSYIISIKDSWTLSQLKSIAKWLNSIKANWTLPLPTDAIAINVNWETIWYQGYVWQDVLTELSYKWDWLNKITNTYISYLLTRDRQNFQLMTNVSTEESLLEVSIVNNSYAYDYSNLYTAVYWSKLWILTDINNTPIQDVDYIKNNWYIDLITNDANTTFNAYIKNDIVYTLLWSQLAYKLKTLSRSSFYWPPIECPIWYIPSWWDAASEQKWFCVAKYEMSYHGKTWNISWWNTFSFADNWDQWKPVSEQWNSPISKISLQEAMTECSTIWKWYHLITNNEWMAIARQIEFEKRNWTNNVIWSWSLWNWISWSSSYWCDWYSDDNKPVSWDAASVSWDNICNWKNVAKLFNWEEIWDFAWNIWEWTNKIFNNTEVFWDGDIEWTDSSISNKQLSEFWPIIKKWVNSWIWRIWNADGYEWRWLKRSWSARDDDYAWIYAMDPYTDWTEIDKNLWFRCAK